MTDGLKDIRNINNKKTDVELLREFYEQYKHTSQTYIDFVNNKVNTNSTMIEIDKPKHSFAGQIWQEPQ